MPATTIYIKPTSGGGDLTNEVRSATVKGATSRAEAIVALLDDITNFPVQFSSVVEGSTIIYIRDTANAVPIDEVNDPPIWWDVTLNYVQLGFSESTYNTGDFETNFEIGLSQVNKKAVKASLELNKYAISGATAPDMKGLIGYNSQTGAFDGVDVDVPVFIWSETHYLSNSTVDASYFSALYHIAINPVSNVAFRGFAAYEPRFLGVQGGRRRKGGDWQLQFRFAANPNLTDFSLGDITSIVKRGWDYVWGNYYLVPDDTIKVMVAKPKYAYVDQVYGNSDFTALGIGTDSLLG